jgi:hypothetical protein
VVDRCGGWASFVFSPPLCDLRFSRPASMNLSIPPTKSLLPYLVSSDVRSLGHKIDQKFRVAKARPKCFVRF